MSLENYRVKPNTQEYFECLFLFNTHPRKRYCIKFSGGSIKGIPTYWGESLNFTLLSDDGTYYSIPFSIVSSAERTLTPDELEEFFYRESEKWNRETAHLSSPSQMRMHPSYKAIHALTKDSEYKRPIICLMLRDQQDNRVFWFEDLCELTGTNPVKKEDAGRIEKMIRAWTQWGKQEDYL